MINSSSFYPFFSSSFNTEVKIRPFFEPSTALHFGHLYSDFHRQHIPVLSKDQFLSNLNNRFNWNILKLDQFDWGRSKSFSPYSSSLYLLAGGAPLNCMHVSNYISSSTQSDLDIFVLGNTEEEQTEAAQKFCNYLAHNREPGEIFFGKKENLIYIWIKNLEHPIQLICIPESKTYEDIICNFDQSCCEWAYDGQEVWCTQGAIQSMITGINVPNFEKYSKLSHYNPLKTNNTFARRIQKMKQKGFSTKVPNMELSSIYQQKEEDEQEDKKEILFPIFKLEEQETNLKLLKEAYGITFLTTKPEELYFSTFFLPSPPPPSIILEKKEKEKEKETILPTSSVGYIEWLFSFLPTFFGGTETNSK